MAVALDSSIVIGFLDRSDGLHEVADAALRSLLPTERLVVSVVTYAAVLAGARVGHHDESRVKGFFDELISQILPVDMAVGDRAATLRARAASLAMPDALIVATAELGSETDVLLTGDQGIAKLRGIQGCELRLAKDP